MAKFQIEHTEDGVECCGCCECPVPVAIFPNLMTNSDYWLCEVCASTYLSRAVTDVRCSDTLLYKSIARLGNMVLAELKKIQEEEFWVDD